MQNRQRPDARKSLAEHRARIAAEIVRAKPRKTEWARWRARVLAWVRGRGRGR